MVNIVVTNDQRIDIALALDEQRVSAKKMAVALAGLKTAADGIAHFEAKEKALAELLEIVRAAR